MKPVSNITELCHIRKLKCVACKYRRHDANVSVVFQEGAMLQDVCGVRPVPGERQEVSTVPCIPCEATLPEHLT
jgi:hypothetical protein